ncbi:MAG: addiction module protein [Acidiferrobacterales bacterium]|nr:addiction module protein [Acidiferrobacterales bacterium]
MTKPARVLLRDALMLDPAERALLADELLHSLNSNSSEVDAAWAIESEKRLEMFLAGKIESYPADEVLSEN